MTTDASDAISSFVGALGDTTIGSLRKHTPADIIKAGTYQGFTDEEIQGLVDFYVEMAHKDEEAKAYQAAYITELNERNEFLKQQYEQAQARMEAVLQGIHTNGRIGADGFPEGGDA